MKDEIIRFGIYDSDSVTDTKYPPYNEKCKDEYIKQLEDENSILNESISEYDKAVIALQNQVEQLETQVKQFKKDYPFFDDADGENYTLKDGKSLECKE